MNAQAAKLKEKQQLIDQFVNYAIGKFEEGDFENAKRVKSNVDPVPKLCQSCAKP